jgi:hypothetical protein
MDLGYFDLETRVLEPLENRFGAKVLPMSQVRCVTVFSPGRSPKGVHRAEPDGGNKGRRVVKKVGGARREG